VRRRAAEKARQCRAHRPQMNAIIQSGWARVGCGWRRSNVGEGAQHGERKVNGGMEIGIRLARDTASEHSGVEGGFLSRREEEIGEADGFADRAGSAGGGQSSGEASRKRVEPARGELQREGASASRKWR